MIEKDILSQRVPFCPRCTQEKKSRRQSNDDPSDDDDDMSHSKAIMKPDIVFFGEALPSAFDKCLAEDRNKVDLLIVMGTSLKVAPVSGIMGKLVDIIINVCIY
jgi:NAD-dependent SIR2 family protein deacetylase